MQPSRRFINTIALLPVSAALLLLSPLAGGVAHAAPGYALLGAGSNCPDAAVAAELRAGVRGRKLGPASSGQTTAAVARVRARRAVKQARQLFTRTNFAGCISLLSIIEQELGRNLAARVDQRGHRLLAVVNFWLGVCQWAAGDPQRATSSFVRSAQLPGAPTPDGKLLPPRLLRHYRKAVAAPREQKTCKLDPSVRAEDLLVDGKGPTLRGGALDVPAGTHYLVLRGRCPAGQARCGAEPRSMRLEARDMGCKVRRPSGASRSALVCINGREAADSDFVGAVVREGDLPGAVVVSRAGDKIALRVLRRGSSSFRRELVSDISPARGKDAASVVRGSLGLLLGNARGVDGGSGNKGGGAGASRDAWYRKWWIWTIVGVAAAATITGIAVGVSSGSDRVDIVFNP